MPIVCDRKTDAGVFFGGRILKGCDEILRVPLIYDAHVDAKESAQVSGEPADFRHLNSPPRLLGSDTRGDFNFDAFPFSLSLILPFLSHLISLFPPQCPIHLVPGARPSPLSQSVGLHAQNWTLASRRNRIQFNAAEKVG